MKGKKRVLYISELNTPIGNLAAGASDEGVLFLEFTDNNKQSNLTRIDINHIGIRLKTEENSHLRRLRREIEEYFCGKRKEFSVSYIISGTEFQREVWTELLKIPFGNTISYNYLAELLGKTGSVRAAANAGGRNKIAIIIPCHRVIGKNGKLTGYAGGLWRKQWLIDHEKKYSGQPVLLSLFDNN